jgi:drug/metabolite transporter, DME family
MHLSRLERVRPVVAAAAIDSQYLRGLGYTVAAGVAFGTLGPLSNIAYRAGMGSPTFAALRATVGALLLAALVVRSGEGVASLRRLPARERLLLALTAGAQAALSLSLFAAYGQMSVALVLAVYFCYPVLVAAGSVALRRELMTPVRGAALVISLAGLALVVLGRAGEPAQVSLPGLVLAAFAALCQATYLLASRTSFTRVPAQQATVVILATAALLAWMVAIPADGPAGRLTAWLDDPRAWIAILVAGSLGAGLAKVWMLRGVRRIGGTRTAVVMLVEPLVGVLLAAALLGQALGAPELLGGMGILTGALLAQRPAKVRRANVRVAADEPGARTSKPEP